MDRQKINRISGIAPFVLSLSAFGVVLFAILTGWGNGYADEGSAAHIFALLIVAEVPFMVMFVATADWKRVIRLAGVFGLQAVALMLAFAPVAYFKL